MKHAVIVYPHQLFKDTSLLSEARKQHWTIYLVEEFLILAHNPVHRQKLLLHKRSMDAYESWLRENAYTVERITLNDAPRTRDVFLRIRSDGVTHIHVHDTTDNYLERELRASGLVRVWYESPLFILEKDEAVQQYVSSGKRMAAFYKQMRRTYGILLTPQGEPEGGAWSYDHENRKKLPKGLTLPEDISEHTPVTEAERAWIASIPAEQYGVLQSWIPHTHEGARAYLEDFFIERFARFGPYEDALTTRGVRLFHSGISPLMNIGLLTPREVLREIQERAHLREVPLPSREGFIRQILGWREFIRASYEAEGVEMRTANFFHHTRTIPDSLWRGETGIFPVDHAVKTVTTYGYTHHIERLMVLGNFFLLTETNPHDVYRWFMANYVDAYDWVMVPNVYGMSQFADGGSFATKPYISGARYIQSMSDYPNGDWVDIWTSLYWHFIALHEDLFLKNPRLSMMPSLFRKMHRDIQKKHLECSEKFLKEYFAT